jgi:uncharacterized protein (DUF427 family)
VAETDRPRILFQTGLPPRYYSLATRKRNVPARGGVLLLGAGGEIGEALVWYYPDPIPAAADIEGHLCFFNERVDREVDGWAQQRPQTQCS